MCICVHVRVSMCGGLPDRVRHTPRAHRQLASLPRAPVSAAQAPGLQAAATAHLCRWVLGIHTPVLMLVGKPCVGVFESARGCVTCEHLDQGLSSKGEWPPQEPPRSCLHTLASVTAHAFGVEWVKAAAWWPLGRAHVENSVQTVSSDGGGNLGVR